MIRLPNHVILAYWFTTIYIHRKRQKYNYKIVLYSKKIDFVVILTKKDTEKSLTGHEVVDIKQILTKQNCDALGASSPIKIPLSFFSS